MGFGLPVTGSNCFAFFSILQLKLYFKYGAVTECFAPCICAGVPVKITSPPLLPPPGPISITTEELIRYFYLKDRREEFLKRAIVDFNKTLESEVFSEEDFK